MNHSGILLKNDNCRSFFRSFLFVSVLFSYTFGHLNFDDIDSHKIMCGISYSSDLDKITEIGIKQETYVHEMESGDQLTRLGSGIELFI